MVRTVERARAWMADRLPAWYPIIAAALVLFAIVGLATIPVWATRRADRLRTEIEAVAEPGRRLADTLTISLAAKTAASRTYAATGERRYLDAYITAREEALNAFESLVPLARRTGSRAAALVDSLYLYAEQLGRWQNGLIDGSVPLETFVAGLPVQDSLYRAALDAALRVEQEFTRQAAVRREQIRRSDRLTLVIVLLLAGIASAGTYIVVRLARQQRRLARRLRSRLRAEEALRAAAYSVSEALTAEAVMDGMVHGALAGSGVTGALIERTDAERTAATVEAAAGEAPAAGTWIRIEDSVLGQRAPPAAGPERPPGVHVEFRSGGYPVCACGPCHVLALPIAGGQVEDRALVLVRPERLGPYAPEEVTWGRILADLGSLALRRAVLLETTERERRRMAALLESTGEGIFGTDIEGRCIFINRSALELLGYRAAEVLGRDIDRLIHRAPVHEERGACWMLDAVRKRRAARDDAAELRRKDGTSFPAQYEAHPIVEAGRVTGAVFTFSDITERRLAERERERLLSRERAARAEAERGRTELMRVLESRARLVRGFSHDVKNPLGAADGHAQLLEGGVVGPLTADQQRGVGRIRHSIRSALTLIEDMVELVRAEAGQIELEWAETDVPEVTRDLVDEYRATASARRIRLERIRAGSVPPTESDPARVRQILGNVISNAVKYTPAGGRITVTVEARPVDDAGRAGPWIAIRVTDTGPGIPREKQEAIFTEYTRLTPGAAPGVGLGLAISRSLARLLGGDLTVASEPGAGSTFTLWLPVGRAAARPAPAGRVPRAA